MSADHLTPAEILDLQMDPVENDAGASSIREYLKALLLQLFIEGEGFSGKRPFGSGAWKYELYKPLVKAGLIRGKYGEDDYLQDCDDKAGNKMLLEAVKAL